MINWIFCHWHRSEWNWSMMQKCLASIGFVVRTTKREAKLLTLGHDSWLRYFIRTVDMIVLVDSQQHPNWGQFIKAVEVTNYGNLIDNNPSWREMGGVCYWSIRRQVSHMRYRKQYMKFFTFFNFRSSVLFL